MRAMIEESIPDIGKDFSVKKDEVVYRCKMIDQYDDQYGIPLYRVQVLGKIDGGRLIVGEPKVLEVHGGWFNDLV